MTTLNPYLLFDGNCEEAFNFYKSAFGGEFTTLQRFKEAPSDQPLAPSESEKIIHVALPVGKTTILMGSDRPESRGKNTMGDNISISVNTDNEEETTKIFNALSTDGEITMPLAKTFWGAYFGMCKDKFGVHWMVSCDKPKV